VGMGVPVDVDLCLVARGVDVDLGVAVGVTSRGRRWWASRYNSCQGLAGGQEKAEVG
jgi:hypothetical protein